MHLRFAAAMTAVFLCASAGLAQAQYLNDPDGR